MDKSTLLQVIGQPGSITEDQAEHLEEIAQNYPYFSLAHLFLAIYNQSRQSMLAQQKIKKAALYVYSRAVLKKLLNIYTISSDSVASQQENSISMEERLKQANEEAQQFFANMKQEMEDFEKKLSTASEEDLDKELAAITESYIHQENNFLLENTPSLNGEQLNETQKEQEELINKFLENESQDFTPVMNEQEEIQEIDIDQVDLSDIPEDVLEADAIIAYHQGDKTRSTKIYLKLSHLQPERKDYYFSQMELLELNPAVTLADNSNTTTQRNSYTEPETSSEEQSFTSEVTEEQQLSSDTSSEEPGAANETPLSEADAMRFYNEGDLKQAVAVYKKLMLQFPDKSAYFASQIEILES